VGDLIAVGVPPCTIVSPHQHPSVKQPGHALLLGVLALPRSTPAASTTYDQASPGLTRRAKSSPEGHLHQVSTGWTHRCMPLTGAREAHAGIVQLLDLSAVQMRP